MGKAVAGRQMAEIDGDFGFVTFHIGIRRADRKSDRADHFDFRVFQNGKRLGNTRTVDAHSAKFLFNRVTTQRLSFGAGGVGFHEDKLGAIAKFVRHKFLN